MSETNGLIEWLSPDRGETAAHPMGEPRSSDERVDLAVIIVSWNVKDILLENLASLFSSLGTARAECIVVDNASHDGSVEAIKQKFPTVHVIANQQNVGPSRAGKQGFEVMRARHVLLLNPDMRVEPAAIQNTIEYLDAHPDAGVVGGRLGKNDGSLFPSVRHFPYFWSQLIIMCKLPHLFAGMLNRYLWKDFDYTKEQSVEVVRGSYFAIHEQAWKKFGPWDARYFLWFEEVDYCKQVIGAGMKVMYVPTIHATDFVSQSFKQVHLYTSQARLTNSLITYFKRWHPRWQSLIFQILRPPLLVAAWIVERGMKLIGRKQYKRIET